MAVVRQQARTVAGPQELNKSKLVFISINVNYEYSGKFDWGRKPLAPARVQHALHAPPEGSARVCAASARLGEIFPRCRMVLDT